MTRAEIESTIASIENEHDTVLLEALSEHAGFFTSERHLLYIAKDFANYPSEGTDTEYLCLQTHVRVIAIDNNPTFEPGYYNIIIFKGELSDNNLESFLNLCTIHARNADELKFKDFFYSLIALFQLPSEQQYLNAVGLFGELKYMEYVYRKYKRDLSVLWHKNGSFSRYDFSNGRVCLEVKTTASVKTNVELKHQQIFGTQFCVLVVVVCEESDCGETIDEVIDKLQTIPSAFSSVNFGINLAKEIKRISAHDLKELRLAVTNILLFNPDTINPFPEVPEEVSSLSYRLDYSELPSMDESVEKELLDSLFE